MIVLGLWHLERLLREYLEDYYHTARPHHGLGGETPTALQDANINLGEGELLAIPVVGGLHHRYQRVLSNNSSALPEGDSGRFDDGMMGPGGTLGSC